MRMKSRGVSASRLVLAFLLLLPLLMICPVLGDDDNDDAAVVPDGADEGNESRAAERKHHKHHLLLFMGGLKSLAAVVLIKIKIVLVVAAIVAVAVFTIKYLLGAAGLPDPAGLFHKGSNYFAPPPPPPPPQQPPQYPEPYHSVVHEPLYGYGYPTPIPWDQANQESYGSDWHKYGDGGRSLLDVTSFYPSLEKVLVQNSFKHKRKRIKRKSNINFKDNKT